VATRGHQLSPLIQPPPGGDTDGACEYAVPPSGGTNPNRPVTGTENVNRYRILQHFLNLSAKAAGPEFRLGQKTYAKNGILHFGTGLTGVFFRRGLSDFRRFHETAQENYNPGLPVADQKQEWVINFKDSRVTTAIFR
jgi:hypothetical protein